MENHQNFQKKTPYPFILKSLAKKRTQRNSILSPTQCSSAHPSSLTRIRSSDSKHSVFSLQSRVVRQCEDILKKVKKQKSLYQAYKIVSSDKRQQLRLQNTIKLLEESIKTKDKTIVKLHRIVKQLEYDYHSLVRSAMKGKNSQVYEEYGFQMPKEERVLVTSRIQNGGERSLSKEVGWRQERGSSQYGFKREVREMAIQTEEIKGVIQNQSQIRQKEREKLKEKEKQKQQEKQKQNYLQSIISKSTQQQIENKTLNKLIDSYKQQCFQKQKQMMYQIKFSSERIQQLQNEIRKLKSGSKGN